MLRSVWGQTSKFPLCAKRLLCYSKYNYGDFIRNVLAGKGDEIIKNMPVISLKSDDFGKIIRMLTDDIDKYQAAINMANELRIA